MDPLLAYKLLLLSNDGIRAYPIAPVAEYKGVALIERPGKVKKVYNGIEYTTDGWIEIAPVFNGFFVSMFDRAYWCQVLDFAR